MKDNDLNFTLKLSEEDRSRVFSQLTRDATALASFGIMDYSLLLGVNNKDYIVKSGSEQQGDLETDPLLPREDQHQGQRRGKLQQHQDVSSNDMLYDSGSMLHHESSGKKEEEEEEEEEEKTTKDGKTRPSSCMHNKLKAQRVIGPAYYYLGIIDILQEWTVDKQMERFWKVSVKGKDPEGVSCVPPMPYLGRFKQKMRDLILPENDEFFV